jgi:hypothetical protein
MKAAIEVTKNGQAQWHIEDIPDSVYRTHLETRAGPLELAIQDVKGDNKHRKPHAYMPSQISTQLPYQNITCLVTENGDTFTNPSNIVYSANELEAKALQISPWITYDKKQPAKVYEISKIKEFSPTGTK